MVRESIVRILSSVIISIGIIVSGYFISSSLSTNINFTLPNNLHVLDDSNEEFLSIFQASAYLSLEHSLFEQLIDSGEFASTYIVLNGQYIFSRSRLDNYLFNLIDSQNWKCQIFYKKWAGKWALTNLENCRYG